jgi:hypothetical protein
MASLADFCSAVSEKKILNNLPLGARKPQRFTNIYNEQYIE